MGDLIARTAPLAVGAAVSPVLLVAVVVLLSGRRSPKPRAVAFALGNVVSLVVVAVVVLRLTHFIGHEGVGHSAGGAIVDLSIGVLLLAFGVGRLVESAVRRWAAHPAPVPDDDATADGADGADGGRGTTGGHGGRSGGFLGSFALGIGLMAADLTTLALYLAALKDVAEARVDAVERAVAVLFMVVVIMGPVLVPIAIAVLAPGVSARVLASLRRFVTRYRNLVMGLFMTFFGVYLVVKGARGR